MPIPLLKESYHSQIKSQASVSIGRILKVSDMPSAHLGVSGELANTVLPYWSSQLLPEKHRLLSSEQATESFLNILGL